MKLVPFLLETHVEQKTASLINPGEHCRKGIDSGIHTKVTTFILTTTATMIILHHLRKETEKRYVVQNLFTPVMPRTRGYDLKNAHNTSWTKAAELTLEMVGYVTVFSCSNGDY